MVCPHKKNIKKTYIYADEFDKENRRLQEEKTEIFFGECEGYDCPHFISGMCYLNREG